VEIAMCEDKFQYVLEMTHRDAGMVLGRVPCKPDWGPIEEALTFELVRRGDLEDFGESLSIRVEPIGIFRRGDRVVQEFRAAAVRDGKVAASLSVTIDYLRTLARRAADQFVEAGVLKAGDFFEYRVLATERPSSGGRSLSRISVEPFTPPVHIEPASIDELMGRALLMGTGEDGDVPAFVRWCVLEEASVLTRQAGELETGGILVGHVRRDPKQREVFLEITAQIPARAHSQLTRLSFSPDTWSDAQAALDLRGKGEAWLGWWHSHSFLKKEVATERDDPVSGDRVARPFLSEEDHLLHRTIFPRAFSLALLLTDAPRSGLSWTMFGWRAGLIARRDFHVIHAPMPESFTSLQGEHYAATR
jgi:hypothetical protein